MNSLAFKEREREKNWFKNDQIYIIEKFDLYIRLFHEIHENKTIQFDS